MKNAWKSLKALLASADDEDFEDLDTDSKEAAKKFPGKDDSEEDPDEKDDADQDKKKEDKKKKSDSSDSDEKQAESEEKEASTVGSVHLALDDYNGLIALASKAKSALAENKTLKAKAAQWDSYQAALSGTKPGADTAGAKTQKQANDQDPDAGLREKYGSLMEDC